ncbi:hypothetical protein LCGC14_1609160 [marine sediment metagenome]|uniref:Uncharacterized protein n=1 Tax=marine sediment metagenome TaxID=412755 RepID=A0A0F9I8W4_9ZZZZ
MKYNFKLQLDYDLEADTEEDAIIELTYIIGENWIDYADQGKLTETQLPESICDDGSIAVSR